eukprot:3358061-Pleurochrysis_carterae.AAC.1
MPHGLTLCSLLFVLVALITCGDAALNNHVVHVRGSAETRAIYTAVMQSMPAMATIGAKSMWLGDTRAGMHCITDAAIAVKGSLRPNTTLMSQPTAQLRPNTDATWTSHFAQKRAKWWASDLRTFWCSAPHHTTSALGNGGTCRTSRGGNHGKVDAVPTRRTRGPAAQRGSPGGAYKQCTCRSIAS